MPSDFTGTVESCGTIQPALLEKKLPTEPIHATAVEVVAAVAVVAATNSAVTVLLAYGDVYSHNTTKPIQNLYKTPTKHQNLNFDKKCTLRAMNEPASYCRHTTKNIKNTINRWLISAMLGAWQFIIN